MRLSIEDKIYIHQEKVITERYGPEEASRANYGWGVEELDEKGRILVSTKIYGPWVKLSTNERMMDTWEDMER